MHARSARLIAFALSLAVAGCATTPAQRAEERGYDGRYAGAFVLDRASSAHDCPYTDSGQAVMTVVGGHARIDVTQAAYFDGQVAPDGALTLSSGQGRTAFIHGRIVNGRYTASGQADCQYQVSLARAGG
jgi:uncharacterized protein YceK